MLKFAYSDVANKLVAFAPIAKIPAMANTPTTFANTFIIFFFNKIQ